MVVGSFLSLCDLMTIETIDVLLRMGAHLELVNDRELGVQMAFGAFAAGADECSARLFDDDARPARVNEVCRQDQGSGNSDRDKDGAEIHPSLNLVSDAVASSRFKLHPIRL